MKTDLNDKQDILKKKILFVKHEMERFFQCDESSLNFSNPLYYDEDKFEVLVRFTLKKVLIDKIISTSNYYFSFEGEYIKREGIWFQGNFYGYNALSGFFNEIAKKILYKHDVVSV